MPSNVTRFFVTRGILVWAALVFVVSVYNLSVRATALPLRGSTLRPFNVVRKTHCRESHWHFAPENISQ